MQRSGYSFQATGSPAVMAGLLLAVLTKGAPFAYAEAGDRSQLLALQGAIRRAGDAQGLDVGATVYPGRLLAWIRRSAPKEVPHAA